MSLCICKTTKSKALVCKSVSSVTTEESSNGVLNTLGLQAVIRPDDQDLAFGDPEEA